MRKKNLLCFSPFATTIDNDHLADGEVPAVLVQYSTVPVIGRLDLLYGLCLRAVGYW